MAIGARRRGDYLLVLQRPPLRAKATWRDHGIPSRWAEKVDRRIHPHAKPAGLITRLIVAVTEPGDLVIDPAAGGFTVMRVGTRAWAPIRRLRHRLWGRAMSRARLPNRCMSDDDIRRTLEPHVFDGTEAVEAIVTLVTSASRPPNLRAAIAKILKLKYAGAVHLDAVIDLLSLDP